MAKSILDAKLFQTKTWHVNSWFGCRWVTTNLQNKVWIIIQAVRVQSKINLYFTMLSGNINHSGIYVNLNFCVKVPDVVMILFYKHNQLVRNNECKRPSGSHEWPFLMNTQDLIQSHRIQNLVEFTWQCCLHKDFPLSLCLCSLFNSTLFPSTYFLPWVCLLFVYKQISLLGCYQVQKENWF